MSVSREYQIVKKIGEGQFAKVYSVRRIDNESPKFALKIDKTHAIRTVNRESFILEALQECKHVSSFISRGLSDDGRNYFVMELLDANLAEFLRKEKASLSLDSKKRILSETLSAIKEVHLNGYIHRDIKPANFAMRPGKEEDWVLLDFGLARRFTRDGEHVERREKSSFRGSVSYASINSHEQQDLSRRDDLWSWFYMFVEMLGELPWRRDKEEMDRAGGAAKLKQKCAKDPYLFFNDRKCPKEIIELNRYLLSLDFQDHVDYDFIQDSIFEIQIQSDGKVDPIGPLNNRFPQDIFVHAEASTKKRDRNSLCIRSAMDNSVNDERSKKLAKPSFKSITCDAQDDTSKKMALKSYGNILQLVEMLRSGKYSEEATVAIDHVRRLNVSESMAIFCDLVDQLVCSTPESFKLAELIQELAGYFTIVAEKCFKKT